MKVISSKEEQGMDVGSTLVRYLLDRGREERKLAQCICYRVESEKLGENSSIACYVTFVIQYYAIQHSQTYASIFF